MVEAKDKFHNVTVSNVYRDTEIVELDYGLVSFDNVPQAILTIFQCISLEGWTKMMYYYSDAYNPWLTHFYFISLIIICSFFILNLTVAILLDNYAENENQEGGLISSAIELTEAGKSAGLPEEVIDFVIHQDITTIKKKKTKLVSTSDQTSSMGGSMTSNIYHNMYISFISHKATIPQHKYYKYFFTRWMYITAVHPLFNTFIMGVILINTIMLAMDRYPEPPEEQENVFYIINIIFTAIFCLEVAIKIIGFSFRGFVRDKFNIFDALVVLVSLLELTLIGDGNGSSLSALRAFRLFRVFKIFRVGDLRVLMDSIAMTVKGMGNYAILLFLFMYLFALLGMQFFAGKFRFGNDGLYSSSGDVPRMNFDSIWEAFITITIIMIGDNWNTVMYYGMLSEGRVY